MFTPAEGTPAPSAFLGGDGLVDTADPDVVALATEIRSRSESDVDYARQAYEWVRDEVTHSVDAGDTLVTMAAGEVLRARRGLCFAKSHLYAALLRREGIPGALCYQRLGDGDGGFILHGIVAVHLEGEWHRQDPRGNGPGMDAQFSLVDEKLVWSADEASGEIDYPVLFAQPADVVVAALESSEDALELCATGLPSEL
ncbi:MAG TPA: transglutaminase family protein [Candidatus Corynebacterium avicola]|uniref:Transglutaminase family protein n=1 Tax=Candidatus Corynebacterium avicola TaxID=2838527 RepID=A0A9D1RSK2_9CORY|nr:transglutaminase family protein [Candidatus Corynebacterium avicola]